MTGFLILGVVVMLVSMWVSGRLKSKFAQYSQIQLQNNMSGAEIAARMLADHGLSDVKITQTLSKVLKKLPKVCKFGLEMAKSFYLKAFSS